MSEGGESPVIPQSQKEWSANQLVSDNLKAPPTTEQDTQVNTRWNREQVVADGLMTEERRAELRKEDEQSPDWKEKASEAINVVSEKVRELVMISKQWLDSRSDELVASPDTVSNDEGVKRGYEPKPFIRPDEEFADFTGGPARLAELVLQLQDSPLSDANSEEKFIVGTHGKQIRLKRTGLHIIFSEAHPGQMGGKLLQESARNVQDNSADRFKREEIIGVEETADGALDFILMRPTEYKFEANNIEGQTLDGILGSDTIPAESKAHVEQVLQIGGTIEQYYRSRPARGHENPGMLYAGAGGYYYDIRVRFNEPLPNEEVPTDLLKLGRIRIPKDEDEPINIVLPKARISD